MENTVLKKNKKNQPLQHFNPVSQECSQYYTSIPLFHSHAGQPEKKKKKKKKERTEDSNIISGTGGDQQSKDLFTRSLRENQIESVREAGRSVL